MIKDKIKGAAAGFLAGLLISTTVVCATTGVIQKELHYNNIKIALDGKTVRPTNANGKYVEPFIIEGTTYLPIRAVASALGLGVDWDASTNTVLLTTGKTQTEAAIPTISNPVALCDYLNAQKEKDILNIKFRYTGNRYDIDSSYMANMVCCQYVKWQLSGDVYTVTIIEYPGDRIVDAHRKGDTSGLTADEKRTYNKALEMLAEAKRNSSNMLELELAINDILCEHIVYDNSKGTSVPDPNDPPRHLTAVGALLDGVANCQGYVDAFYLLASMAGFEVGRQYVVSDDGAHVTNTVCLNGKWYVVDVTFNDTESETNHLFNAGEDMCTEYWWSDDVEYHTVAEYSDENYYYYLPEYISGDDYTKVFTSINEMVDMIADEWLNNGITDFQTVLLGYSVNWSALSEPLYERLDQPGIYFEYTTYSYDAEENTFFRVVFK